MPDLPPPGHCSVGRRPALLLLFHNTRIEIAGEIVLNLCRSVPAGAAAVFAPRGFAHFSRAVLPARAVWLCVQPVQLRSDPERGLSKTALASARFRQTAPGAGQSRLGETAPAGSWASPFSAFFGHCKQLGHFLAQFGFGFSPGVCNSRPCSWMRQRQSCYRLH